jgi:hypothetical protein
MRSYHGLKTAFCTKAGPKATFSAKAIATDQIVREHIYPTLLSCPLRLSKFPHAD